MGDLSPAPPLAPERARPATGPLTGWVPEVLSDGPRLSEGGAMRRGGPATGSSRKGPAPGAARRSAGSCGSGGWRSGSRPAMATPGPAGRRGPCGTPAATSSPQSRAGAPRPRCPRPAIEVAALRGDGVREGGAPLRGPRRGPRARRQGAARGGARRRDRGRSAASAPTPPRATGPGSPRRGRFPPTSRRRCPSRACASTPPGGRGRGRTSGATPVRAATPAAQGPPGTTETSSRGPAPAASTYSRTAIAASRPCPGAGGRASSPGTPSRSCRRSSRGRGQPWGRPYAATCPRTSWRPSTPQRAAGTPGPGGHRARRRDLWVRGRLRGGEEDLRWRARARRRVLRHARQARRRRRPQELPGGLAAGRVGHAWHAQAGRVPRRIPRGRVRGRGRAREAQLPGRCALPQAKVPDGHDWGRSPGPTPSDAAAAVPLPPRPPRGRRARGRRRPRQLC